MSLYTTNQMNTQNLVFLNWLILDFTTGEGKATKLYKIHTRVCSKTQVVFASLTSNTKEAVLGVS